MQKKIIAAAALVLALTLLFVACGKGPTIVTKEGYEYPLVTDAEGNTVLDDNGDLLIYVTDENGKYVEDANGEPQTNAVTFPDQILGTNKIETAQYVMTYPEGWTISETGKAYYGDNQKTYVKVIDLGELEGLETLDSVFAEKKEAASQISESIEKGAKEKYNAKSVLDFGEVTLTQQKLLCKTITYSLIQEDGTQLYFAKDYYFVYNGRLFNIDYICQDGIQDTSYNVDEILNTGLTMKG